MIRLLAVTLMVGLFGLTGVAAVRVGAEPRTRTVTGSWLDGAMTESGEPSSEGHGLGLHQRASVRMQAGRDDLRPGSVTGLYRGHTARYYDAKFRGMRHLAYLQHKRIKQLKRVLFARPSVTEAINLACVVYGNCRTLWRKAGCETGGTYSPRSLNSSSSASGLFQFLPSTWRTTPYGRFDVFSPYANALAAGWMHARGRGGEWECR